MSFCSLLYTMAPFAVYGFGTLAVLIISFGSLLGAVVIPCMKHSKFDLIMLFFVAMAIGTLVTDAVLHLIPEVSFKEQTFISNQLRNRY